MDELYAGFLLEKVDDNKAGSIKDIQLRRGRLVTEIAYNFQEICSPKRDAVFSFYVPETSLSIDYVKLNIYFPGLQVGDYPDNSTIIYIPALQKGTFQYWNGVFYEFGQGYHQAGTGADGAGYGWYRAYQKFNISPLVGFKLKTCEVNWLLASLASVGAGANAQHSMHLEAVADYGTLDVTDWGLSADVDYGAVNLYNDTPGIIYTKDVKTRVQSLADIKQTYGAFRFVSDAEPTDVANANNFRINEPLLYCELEEDTAQKITIHTNDGPGFGTPLTSISSDKEDMDITGQFSGDGKKQIKFSATPRMRRIEALIRIGLRQGGAA